MAGVDMLVTEDINNAEETAKELITMYGPADIEMDTCITVTSRKAEVTPALADDTCNHDQFNDGICDLCGAME
jgi:hypothetical protein